jgi:cytochrome P450
MPFLDRLLIKNSIRMWMSKLDLLNLNSPVVEFAKKRMAETSHFNEMKSGDQEPPEDGPKRKDFLTRFKEAGVKDPAFIGEERVLALTVANMFAGSDTTAISLRAIFYYLLKDPSKMQKLTEELSYQSTSGKFTRDDGLVRWEEARELPYLGAVISEALRCHPAVGLTLERVVPSQGVTIAGHFLPGGIIAGCSAWVLHRDETIFGSHPEEFRPERWIDASPEQRRGMSNALFSFGAGARTCIGKNISLLEMYKLVPAVIRTFEVSVSLVKKNVRSSLADVRTGLTGNGALD